MNKGDNLSHQGDPRQKERPGWFATTRWSLVLNASGTDSGESGRALSSLCQAYWLPLYTYIRRRGHSAHDAQDLTQEFFSFLLARNHFAKADPDRGRFRSFLLGTLKKFLSDQHDKANAQKRGGGQAPLSLDFDSAERGLIFDTPNPSDPERDFDRGWALTLLEQTMNRLRSEHQSAGKEKLFLEIEPAITGEKRERPYAEIGAALDLSEGSIKMAILRARRRYGELLREEIAQTVSSPADIDEEIRGLFSSLRN